MRGMLTLQRRSSPMRLSNPRQSDEVPGPVRGPGRTPSGNSQSLGGVKRGCPRVVLSRVHPAASAQSITNWSRLSALPTHPLSLPRCVVTAPARRQHENTRWHDPTATPLPHGRGIFDAKKPAPSCFARSERVPYCRGGGIRTHGLFVPNHATRAFD